MVFVYRKLAQFAVRGALPPRRSESSGCAADNKPSCSLHLLGSFIGSRAVFLLGTKARILGLTLSTESVMPSNHLIFCRPLLLLPSIFPSIRVISNEPALRIRWPKFWSFSFNISPSNEHPGLISFRMDWLDLLAVQGTLKSLLQHHSSVLSFLYSPTLTFIHDYWENHSLD